jgi:TonB family protein
MKKTLLALIVIFLLAHAGAAQSLPGIENDEAVAGPVQTILIEQAVLVVEGNKLIEKPRRPISKYMYDEKGNMTRKIFHRNDGAARRQDIFKYNPEGGVLEGTIHDEKGAIERKLIYKRDDAGKKAERESYGKGGSLSSKAIYNSMGKIAEEKGSSGSSTVYDYDPEGRKIEEQVFNSDGSLNSRTVLKHQDGDKRLEMSHYDGTGSLEGRMERVFQVHDPLKCEMSYYTAKGSKAWTWTFSYDHKATLFRDEFKNHRGVFTTEYDFEFNYRNNWIKKTAVSKSLIGGKERAESGTVVYRTITYYAGSDRYRKVPLEEESLVSGEPIQGEAIKRVTPTFPLAARNNREAGTVVVDITIDETGKVMKAKAVSGPLVFYSAAVAAAREWEFRPTLLGGLPTKVIASVTFNFTP